MIDRKERFKHLIKHGVYELSNLSKYHQQVTGGLGFLRSFIFQSSFSAVAAHSMHVEQSLCRKYTRLMKVESLSRETRASALFKNLSNMKARATDPDHSASRDNQVQSRF